MLLTVWWVAEQLRWFILKGKELGDFQCHVKSFFQSTIILILHTQLSAINWIGFDYSWLLPVLFESKFLDLPDIKRHLEKSGVSPKWSGCNGQSNITRWSPKPLLWWYPKPAGAAVLSSPAGTGKSSDQKPHMLHVQKHHVNSHGKRWKTENWSCRDSCFLFFFFPDKTTLDKNLERSAAGPHRSGTQR